MKKSDYYYDFKDIVKQRVLVISDLDLGELGLVDKMESVLFEIEGDIHRTLDNHAILYCNSRGIYEEIRKQKEEITIHRLGETNMDNALKRFLHRE